MDDMHKLKHQIEHWIEHNVEHTMNYMDWANRAEAAGKPEAAKHLRKIAEESARLETHFKNALNAL